MKVIEYNKIGKEGLYFNEEVLDKQQLVIHHTVSGSNAENVINWWLKKSNKISTPFVIDRDGTVYKVYSTRYWSHHLGISIGTFKKYDIPLTIKNSLVTNNTDLNKHAIGIELNSWGGLVKATDGQWYSVYHVDMNKNPKPNAKPIPKENVQEYKDGYRGYYGFEKYTKEQIESLGALLVILGNNYNISLSYNESMWDVSKEALAGANGIWSHISFRDDKSDAHPQPELIEMLKNISKLISYEDSYKFI